MNMTCQGCSAGQKFPVDFSMAFQPIVNVTDGTIYVHEALVRGPKGEGAPSVLSAVDDENRYAFDQQCRVKAIELASQVFPQKDLPRLSINFMPNAVYEPCACIRLTLATATKTGFPTNKIIFVFTETEKLDTQHVLTILATYREIGFMTAIDDFGAGHAGLGLLAKFQPDIVKLDIDLIRNIDTNFAKRTIVRHTVAMLKDIGIIPICEGIETRDDASRSRSWVSTLCKATYSPSPCSNPLPQRYLSGSVDAPSSGQLDGAVLTFGADIATLP